MALSSFGLVERRLWLTAERHQTNSKLKVSECFIPVLGIIFLAYADQMLAAAYRRTWRKAHQNEETMRYSADITSGSLKVTESRVIADLLLRRVSRKEWDQALYEDNALQTRSRETAKRFNRLIRRRLTSMEPDLWKLVRDGNGSTSTHACLAAAVKCSFLLGDFLDLVVRNEYRAYSPTLSNKLWEDYLGDCRNRDPEMGDLSEATRDRLRSTVFQVLAQAGYLENTRTLKLQTVHIDRQVLAYLQGRDEKYVLKCIQVAP